LNVLRAEITIAFYATRPLKPPITTDLLERLDIRVGTIEQLLDLPDSKRLVQLLVDFRDPKRNIVAGMKQERANPREFEGKQALFVLNLETRRIQGVISEGMLFDVGYADGLTPVLAVPEAPVPNGTRAG